MSSIKSKKSGKSKKNQTIQKSNNTKKTSTRTIRNVSNKKRKASENRVNTKKRVKYSQTIANAAIQTTNRTNNVKNIRFFEEANKFIGKNPSVIHPVNFFSEWKPDEVKRYIFGDNLPEPIRNYIERVNANAQCERAGIVFNDKNTKCWICGCVIGNEPKACEHILPVLRAVMFKGIITTNEIMKKPEFEKANKELLQRVTKENYLWAHSNCNGSKSGSVLLTFDKHTNTFIPNIENCRNLEIKIRSLRKGVDCYKNTFYQNIYKRLHGEMVNQCISINEELQAFKVSDNVNYVNNYIQYTIDVIKLYANSTALQSLEKDKQKLKKEKKYYDEKRKQELDEKRQIKAKKLEEIAKKLEQRAKRLEEETKKLKKEQNELIQKIEREYRSYLQSNLIYLGQKSNYENMSFLHLNTIIRLNCSSMLSRRVETLNYYPPKEITQISDEITTIIFEILNDFFNTYRSLTINLVYAIIDLFCYSLIIIKTKIINVNIEKRKCELLYILINAIKDQFYLDTDPITYIREYNEKPQFKKISDYLNKNNITINIDEGCNEYITKELNERFIEKEPKPELESYTLAQLIARTNTKKAKNTTAAAAQPPPRMLETNRESI